MIEMSNLHKSLALQPKDTLELYSSISQRHATLPDAMLTFVNPDRLHFQPLCKALIGPKY